MLQAPTLVQPVLSDIVPHIVGLFQSPRKEGKGMQKLYLNAAACLGRLGVAFTSMLAPQLGGFLPNWSGLMADASEGAEKEAMLAGLYCLIKANPQASLPSARHVLCAIGSTDFSGSNDQLKRNLSELLHEYKKAAGANWNQAYASLPQETRDGLAKYYQFA